MSYFLLTYIILFLLFYFLKSNKNSLTYDWIVYTYRIYYVYNTYVLNLISYFFDLSKFYFLNFIYFYKNSFIDNLILELFYSRYSFVWSPLFKRHSYFGYNRSMRQKWIDIKSEEVNRIKY
jgi:hypothetical protein